MKVGFLLDSFPKLSETFILNQITDLIDNHVNVSIFVLNHPVETVIHDKYFRYGLDKLTTYAPRMPYSHTKKYRKAIVLFFQLLLTRPFVCMKSINIFKYKRSALNLRLLFQASMFSVRNSKFDVIHAHFGPIGNIAVNLLEINAISGRLITSFHGYDINKSEITQIGGYYDKLFLRGAGFIANSIYSRNKLQQLGCITSKIHKIPNPVDTTTFNNSSKVFYTPDKKIALLTVGRLSSEKGHIYALRAIDELLRKDVDLLYHIVGDGPQRNEIERFIASKNMQNRVILQGVKSQGEIVEVYRSADVFMLPAVISSTNEVDTQAIVIQEAQAMNLPVIASRVGGIPEGIIDGQTGFIIEPEDIKSLEEKILYLINNPDKLKEMGVKARDFVKQKYDNKAVIKELLRLYQDSKNYSK